jgi:hypothetical protein
MKAVKNSLILAWVVVIICATSTLWADFTFGDPVKFGPAVGSSDDIVCFSSDGLEMYINRGLGTGYCDLWVLKRASVDDDWGPPVNLGPAINSPQDDAQASISADGLTFYFQSTRPGGYGATDIYMATRATQKDSWTLGVNMGPTINSSADDCDAWISADGLELYFMSNRSGGYGSVDIWVARRATEHDPWGVPANLGGVVNSAYNEALPCLSPDGLLLFFMGKYRPGGYGSNDFWMTRRASLSDPWQTPVNLGPRVNGPGIEFLPRIAPDGHTLLFGSDRTLPWDSWQAPILPIVDFNGDEIVDIKDLLRLIESWGKDDPSVDMGPMPWGDGIVDEADLRVLMDSWGEETHDPALIAHWTLDEREGDIACDSASGFDGLLNGNPVWEPDGGYIDGALHFNGVDDYIETPYFVLNPGDGSFSAFAWIEGGAPGQVVLARIGVMNWLMAATDGCLKTDPKPGDRGSKALASGALVTDGNWHRVGLVQDGVQRILYVDDVEVARDTQPGLSGSYSPLHIGAGKGLEPGSFWSGLIDDVRLYNRAVKP